MSFLILIITAAIIVPVLILCVVRVQGRSQQSFETMRRAAADGQFGNDTAYHFWADMA